MSLQLTVDTLDSIPEPVRGFYEEAEGKFRLKVEGLEDTSGLKKALESERKNASEAAKLAKAYKDLGMSADDIKALVEDKKKLDAEKASAEEKAALARGEFDKILGQHREKWDGEKSALQKEIEAARASEREAVVGTKLMAALTKIGATEEGVDLLPDRLANRIKYDLEDGKRVLRIMSADGETPLAGSGQGGTATFDDLAKEAVTKWPSLFKGSGAGGGGKPPGSAGGSGKTMTRAAFDALGPTERVATIKAGTQVVD